MHLWDLHLRVSGCCDVVMCQSLTGNVNVVHLLIVTAVRAGLPILCQQTLGSTQHCTGPDITHGTAIPVRNHLRQSDKLYTDCHTVIVPPCQLFDDTIWLWQHPISSVVWIHFCVNETGNSSSNESSTLQGITFDYFIILPFFHIGPFLSIGNKPS